MTNNENNTDFVKLAMASLMISLTITMMLGFYSYSMIARASGQSLASPTASLVYTATMQNTGFMMAKNTPTQTGCEIGDTECTTGIASTQGTSPNFITDIISTLVALGKAVIFIVEIVGLTLLCPIVVGVTANQLISNSFVLFLINIFTTLWMIVQGWLVWRLFITKRA